MPTTTEPPFRASRYTTGAIALHWSIAILVILQIAGGYAMGSLVAEGSALQYSLFQLHKSVGVTVLLLTVARIVWRLFNPPPAEPATLSRFERILSGVVHRVFYFLLVAIPLAGWVVITVSPIQVATILYDQAWLPWPHLPGFGGLAGETREAIEGIAAETHEILAYAMGVLVLLHIAAAVKHQVEDGRYLHRMTPSSRGDGPRSAYGQATTVLTTLVIAGGIIGTAAIARHDSQLERASTGVSPDQAGVLGSGAVAPVDGPRRTAFADAGSAPDGADPSAAEPGEDAQAVMAGAATEVAAVTPAPSASEGVPDWTMRPDESTLAFSFAYQNAEVEARFGTFGTTIAFDPDDLAGSSITVSVDLSSAEITAGSLTLAQLTGPDGLSTGGEAVATFTSDTIREAGDGSYVADGLLRLRGAQEEVSLSFTLDIEGDVARAEGTATLDRLAFGVGSQSDPSGGTVGLQVDVRFLIMADRQ